MAGETSTPDSKSRKASNPGSAERNKHQQRRQPHRHGKQQAISHPEWDENQNASGDVGGDFDENGQFVMNNTLSGTSSTTKSTKKHKERKPKGQTQTQPQAIPAWDHSLTQSGEGDFDVNGNFVMPNNNSEPGYPNSAKVSKPKAKAKQATQNVPTLPSGVSAISASPSRPMGFGATPMKAYAGPTFHASPAASELPMPKFFSRSVPMDMNQNSLSSMLRQEESQDSQNEQRDSSSEDNSPPAFQAHANRVDQRNESPLDIFFNADRAEKAAKASRQSTGASESAPPAQMPNTQGNPTHWASIYGARPKHNRNYSTGSTKDIFSMDMENDASSMRANYDPHSPSKGQFRTPESTPDPTRRLGHGVWNNPSASPTDRPVSVPAPAHAPYPFTPRSAGSTPPLPPNVVPDEQTVHHYGNRNLSPLFTAMKADSARRQSSLRNQILHSPQTQSEPFGATASNPDAAKSSAMDFLNAQISKSANRPFDGSLTGGHVPPGIGSGMAHSPAHVQPTNARIDGNSGDLKSMENDLKRMLNLSGGSGFNPGF